MDLIVTMDDATSESYSMILVEEEGTASTFQALGEVIGERGLFCALYTDRGSHYFYTLKAGEKVSKTQQTQVGRGVIASRDRAYRGVFAGGARTLRADVRHAAGSVAKGPAARRHSGRSKLPMRG